MEKGILLVAAIMILFSCKVLRANQADDFKFDEQQIRDEFMELNRLEQTVIDKSFMTFDEMLSQNLIPAQFSNLNVTHSMMMDPALGIPGFWWGCIFGPIGIIAVYIISEKDEVETKQALTGCIVSGGVEIILMVAYYVWVFSYLESGI